MPIVRDLDLPRHPVALDLRRVPLYRFDVVVVGGGAAGGAAALAAAERGASVAVLTKADLSEGNTRYAQGGMAAVMHPEDSFDRHAADTLRVGCGLCDPVVVERVVREGPTAVERLLTWGARFDCRADGSLDLSKEGGHGHPRILHAQGDSTGVEIQGALDRAIAAEERITPFAGTFVVDLLTSDERAEADGGGRVHGCLAVRESGESVGFHAGAVILATGGAGQLYRETTNPQIATGDGVALGARAGAALRDLEFFQFHPTCLYIAGAARVLISEIVRGAGGVLRDRDGARFMPEYHPDAELAPRDVVSRAVFDRMVATGDTSVYLDFSDIDGDPHAQFPAIGRICRVFGIDIARDPVPVRPGAHYMIGGLAVDADGRTTVPGLWAVGECASSGLHGANRMGSNSLLEGVVLGTRAGEHAQAESELGVGPGRDAGTAPDVRADGGTFRVNVQDVTYSLKSLLWRQLGVARHADGLADALDKIALWTRAVDALAPRDPRTFELQNMLLLARLAVESAAFLDESRGVHRRLDFPDRRDALRAHTRVVPVIDGPRLTAVRVEREPVPEPAPTP